MVRLKYNGDYIDSSVSGLKILGIRGRHEIEIGLKAKDNIQDGSEINGARVPSRTITVYAYIPANTDADRKGKIDDLYKNLYTTEEVTFSFSDENDRYYKGAFLSSSITTELKDDNIISFTLFCSDPYKHGAVQTQEQYVDEHGNTKKKIVITNGGNVPCPIEWHIDFNSECGYVSLVDEDGNYLIFGDQEEEDTEKATKSVYFQTSTPKLVFDNYKGTDKGSIGISNTGSSVVEGTVTLSDGNCPAVIPYDWGSAGNYTYYGPCISKSWTADSANVRVQCHPLFATGNTESVGEFIMALNANGKTLASIALKKAKKGTLAATAYARLHDSNGGIDQTESVSFSCNDSVYNAFCTLSDSENKGLLAIRKEKGKFNFNIAGTEFTLLNSDFASVKPDTLSLMMLRSKNSAEWVYNIGVRDASIRRDNVVYRRDIPNRYANGDSLVVYGSKGYMRKNGSMRNGDEVLGSKYFMIPPGTHTILFGYSKWCASPPHLSAKWRNRWI